VWPLGTLRGVTDLLSALGSAPGLYRGRGDGPESGPFVARIQVATTLRGRAIILDYEASNDRNGLQHLEHSVLTPGENGRLELPLGAGSAVVGLLGRQAWDAQCAKP